MSADASSKKSFTDIFIKSPVLAVVVNLIILAVGWRSISGLPVLSRQSTVSITSKARASRGCPRSPCA
jgi:hypothetical protein